MAEDRLILKEKIKLKKEIGLVENQIEATKKSKDDKIVENEQVEITIKSVEDENIKLEEQIQGLEEQITELDTEFQANNHENLENEIGDLLFAISSLARKLEINPEQALNKTLDKFAKRFSYIEKKVKESGQPFDAFTLDELETWWVEAKEG